MTPAAHKQSRRRSRPGKAQASVTALAATTALALAAGSGVVMAQGTGRPIDAILSDGGYQTELPGRIELPPLQIDPGTIEPPEIPFELPSAPPAPAPLPAP